MSNIIKSTIFNGIIITTLINGLANYLTILNNYYLKMDCYLMRT